jgi:DNA repair ATPase RecN
VGKTGVVAYDNFVDKLKTLTVGGIVNKISPQLAEKLNIAENEGMEIAKSWNSYSNIKNMKPLKKILEAQEFLQVIAAQTQSIVEKKLSKLVTSALHTVYPENPYNFILRFEKKRNATECKLLFEKNEQEFNPLEESGGGPIDIASIALLISFIMIEKKNPIIILDEPMKHMSKKRSIIAAKFLKSICENLGLQIIMVTHLDEIILHAHKSFEIIEGTVNE